MGPDLACADEGAGAGRAAATVSHRSAEAEGGVVGEVLINDQVVMRLRATAGELSPVERAMVVASRLRAWLQDPAAGELSVLATEQGAAVIAAGTQNIVSVLAGDAHPIGALPADLAYDWLNLIYVALGEEPPPPSTEAATGEWTPEEPYRDKIVPIISVLSGTRVGAARVSGPQSRVRLVQAVAQLETDFRRVLEIDIYVPVSTSVPGRGFDRVQGVGVTALGDLKL